jgi:hypothetical protein
VAVAEAGRAGEVRFLGEVENTPAWIERIIKKLAARHGRLQVCLKQDQPVTGCIGQIQEKAWSFGPEDEQLQLYPGQNA